MDSFSSHSKFEFCKMKVVICISIKLTLKPTLLLGLKISNKKTMSCKQKCKKDLKRLRLLSKRLSKIYYSMFMIKYRWNMKYSLSIHLFYGWFYTFMPYRSKSSYSHTDQQLKDVDLFKFIWHFSTTHYERDSFMRDCSWRGQIAYFGEKTPKFV